MGEEVTLVHFRPQKTVRTKAEEHRRHGELLKALTVDIVNTYSRCSSAFGYSVNCAPRRVLTKNSKGVHNGGHDNAEHDYICRVGDKITNPDGHSYETMERLGHGTFGQVLKCVPTEGGPAIALKIIKNKPAYFHQALVEVRILQMLNQEFDPDDEHRIVRMLDFFVYRKHLCIAFELLSVNLYDVLRQNSFRGVSVALIRVLTEQLLKALRCLREAFVVHCDLKPENVLLVDMHHTRIKLIDFGSACFEKHSVYSYIQSRFYRSPEVLLGLPYTSAIDLWSLGCICAELFLGLPIFPGHSEYNQVCRIVDIMGTPPAAMLDRGRSTRRYFRRVEEAQDPTAAPGEGAAACSGGDASEGSVADCAARPGVATFRPLFPARRAGEESDDEPEPSETDCGMPSPPCGQAPCAAGEKADSSPEEPPSAPVAEEDAVETTGGATGSAATALPADGAQAAEGSDSQPGASAAGPPASQEGPKQDGESILDLQVLQRKLGELEAPHQVSQPLAEEASGVGAAGASGGAQQGGSAGAATTSAGAQQGGLFVFGSGGKGQRANTEPLAAPSESGRSVGSTLSTAAETSEAVPPRRRAPSNDELVPRDGSSDGHCDPRASGSSDGGRVPRVNEAGASSESARDQQARRCRGWRRNVRTSWRLKTREEFERDEHKKEPTPKKYFELRSLEQMMELSPYKNQSQRALKEEQEKRQCFLHFLRGVLQMNPDERWTPMQAWHHNFIQNEVLDPDFQPPPDTPVPSFTCAPLPRPGYYFPPPPGAVAVPRLPAEAMGPFSACGPSTGGGSARTVQESAGRQHGTARGMDAEQPRSAPASTRGGAAGPSATAPGARAATGARSDLEREGEAAMAAMGPGGLSEGAAALPEGAFPGHWRFPDEAPAESYRPPIDQMPEDFFRSVVLSRNIRMPPGEHAAHDAGSPQMSQKARNGAWSVSTGASLCSSASSTGSTPTGGRGRCGVASPHSGGSPFSAGGAPMKGLPHTLGPELKMAGRGLSRHQLPGPVTPASSPHGSAASASAAHSGGGAAGAGGLPVQMQTPHRLAVHAGGPSAATSRAAGSRDGSRGSSPWHMSEPSTMSDRIHSSQPSGSESCGENPHQYEGHHCNDDDFGSEDPSQSDHWPRTGSTQQSDSDCTTPRSHEAGPTRAEEQPSSARDQQQVRWESMIARTSLGRRMEMAQSPGSAGATGNFREAMGMKEGGPVVPHGLGTRRDAGSSMVTLQGGESESAAPAGPPQLGYSRYSPLPRTQGGADSGHWGHKPGGAHALHPKRKRR